MEPLPQEPEKETPQIEEPQPETPPEPSLPEHGVPVSFTPPEIPETPTRPESPVRSFTRSALRWLIVVLLAGAAGFALAYFLIAQPARLSLVQENKDLDSARTQVASLQARVDSLTALEKTNQTLQQTLNQQNLHLALLSSLKDVMSARVAALNNKPADVHLALSKTGDKLKNLQSLLPAEQQPSIQGLQDRLKLVLGEVDSNPHAATSDLEVLSSDMNQLENTLFSNP